MIVLGIDPSYRATGLAVLDWQDTAGRYVPGTEQVACTGVASAPKRPGEDDEATRRRHIAEVCSAWAHTHCVALVCLEEPCRGKNAATDAMLQRLSATIADRLAADGYTVELVNNRKRIPALGLKGKTSEALKLSAVRAAAVRYGITVTTDEADAIGHALAGVRQWFSKQRQGGQLGLGLKTGKSRHRRRR
jgi:Holliday junction resolvasome RuvABC endonuclease subunit